MDWYFVRSSMGEYRLATEARRHRAERDQSTSLLIPWWSRWELKFISRPTRRFVSRKYVSTCASNTGSILSTLFNSTTIDFSTMRSIRCSQSAFLDTQSRLPPDGRSQFRRIQAPPRVRTRRWIPTSRDQADDELQLHNR